MRTVDGATGKMRICMRTKVITLTLTHTI